MLLIRVTDSFPLAATCNECASAFVTIHGLTLNAKLYSPLFVRCCNKKLNARTPPRSSSKSARKRTMLGLMANPPAVITPTGTSYHATAAVKAQEPWREDLGMNLICKECKEDPPNIVEDFSAGDTVCGSCGLVLGDRIVDTRSEWRTFTNDDQNNDDPSRVGDGANPLLNGAQLQTDIAFIGGASAKSRDLSRAQNKATHDKSTQTLLAAYKHIGSLCDGIGIPKNVSDTAKHLFKIVHDENAFRGKSQETVIAGCIFIACRQCKVPRTFREIFDLTKVSKPEIGRVFKHLERFFAGRNEKMKASIVEAGGKLFLGFLGVCSFFLLTPPFFQVSPIPTALASTLLWNRPPQRTFASASAAS